MTHSKTSICNSALRILGKDPLVVDAESGQPQEYGHADAAVSAYDQRLGRVLRSHPWNFAMNRAVLEADGTPPKFGWAFRYLLPAVPPCARVWKLNPDLPGDGPKFTVEAGYILTNEPAPLRVLYIARITDPSFFDDDFAEAFAGEIAAKIAPGVLGSLEAADFFRKEARQDMTDAKTDNSQEVPPPDLDGGTFLPFRRTG